MALAATAYEYPSIFKNKKKANIESLGLENRGTWQGITTCIGN